MGRTFVSQVVEKIQKTEKHMDHWTSAEKDTCKSRYGCDIMIENGSYADVCTKEAPNDAYIIKYFVEDKICFDLTRGSRTRLFDMYWDKFRENLKSISFGYGRHNPKTWGYKAPEKKKRK
ncbi:MAG: hypothetical protein EBS19_01140 [Spirochaetia bacterium]|nr:hypothetical protein [Spirochaetia bacterium]